MKQPIKLKHTVTIPTEKYHKLAIEYTKLTNRHERLKKLLSLILHADTNPRRNVKLTKYYRKKIRKELK